VNAPARHPCVAGIAPTIMRRQCPIHHKPLPCRHCELRKKPVSSAKCIHGCMWPELYCHVCSLRRELDEPLSAMQRKNNMSVVAEPSLAIVPAEAPPPSVPVKRKRGRPPGTGKYKNDEERRAADAARKRREYAAEKMTTDISVILAEHHDFKGRAPGEVSGGYGPNEISYLADETQAVEASGLGTCTESDEYGGVNENTAPDRRRAAPAPTEPGGRDDVNWDAKPEEREYDNSHVERIMRRLAGSIKKWIHQPPRKRKRCPDRKHDLIVRENIENPRKVICPDCCQVLVEPGQWVWLEGHQVKWGEGFISENGISS